MAELGHRGTLAKHRSRSFGPMRRTPRDHRWRAGGNTAATVAATLGAEVTLVERDIIGGAAHLWDCIPSKAMIATGGELSELDAGAVDGARGRRAGSTSPRCASACASIEEHLQASVRSLESQGVRLVRGTGRLSGPARGRRSKPTTGRRGARRRLLHRSPPARGRASRTGRRSTASASSPRARPTRPRRSPSTSA